MKKIFTTLFSVAALAFAADIQVLPPSGAEFAPDAPNMVQSLVRASVSETGNTPVDNNASIQLRTNVMTMGSTIVVVCEQVNNGTVVGSGKQKAGSIDELDVAIEGAVKSALANASGTGNDQYAATASRNSEPEVVVMVPAEQGNSEDPNDNFARKRPTRNYNSYGLGAGIWHNYDFTDKHNPKHSVDMSWEKAFVFHYARIFEVIPQAAITIVDNMNISFGDEWELHDVFLLGGRYFPSTGVVTPFIGAGLGIGIQTDDHYYDKDEAFAIGLATGAELGVVFFRNSAIQLEIGFAWDAMWDGFESFDRRFGAGSAYIAINY